MPRIMQNLRELAFVPDGVRVPAYPREDVRIGIAHIGIGGFHRAHQCRYLDDYMAASGDLGWGICGIGLMPGDRPLIEMLKRQNGLFTLTEKDDSGTETRILGSMSKVMFAPDDNQAVIDALADPNIKIISMTVTEGGYRYDFEKDRFFSEHPDILHDLAHPQTPKTLFGYLWRACRLRSQLGDRGRVTLLSCDNVPHNGDVLRKAMLAFIDMAEPELKPWFEASVSFPNSMVDRITPAPGDSDRQYLCDRYQLEDDCAVGCETFIQWVVEDNFAAGRPALEQVGVQFTDDVAPYEMTKLRLLNGSHLMMGFIGYLAGYDRVDLAIKDPGILRLVQDYMRFDAEPSLPVIADTPVREYQATLIERFGNSRIADQQMRICSDGYTKLKNYLMPLVWELLNKEGDTRRLSFLFACFLAYLDSRADDGSVLQINEFNLPEELNRATRDNRVALFATEPFFGRTSEQGQSFLSEVHEWHQHIEGDGAYRTLERLLAEYPGF